MGFENRAIQLKPLLGQIWRGGPHVELVDYIVAPWVETGDGIVISGFWRSGTTWAQQMVTDMLGAKSVFEPLDPRVLVRCKKSSGLRPSGSQTSLQSAFMPFTAGSQFQNAPLQQHLALALQAKLPGRWVRRARKGPNEAFRKRVVVKLVRGQLSLQAIGATFGVPVVHIYRDPRAVISSVLRAGWGKGWLTDVDLGKILLNPNDGRRKYFGQWEDAIMNSANLDPVSRIASYWALTERFVIDNVVPSLPKLVMVQYEDLAANPILHLSGKLAEIGVRIKDTNETESVHAAQESSPTSGSKRARQSMAKKMSSWKSELTKKEIIKIEAIADRFKLSDRLVG